MKSEPGQKPTVWVHRSVIHNHNGQKPTKRMTDRVSDVVPVAT